MKISERPEFASKPKPLTLTKEESVAVAVSKMADKNFGSVMVVDEAESLVGIVTERDILKRLVNADRDAKKTKLVDIMTTDIRVAKKDDQILDWLQIMSNERFRRLPVVDEQNRVQAVMTQGDFVSYTWPDLIYQAKQITLATITTNYRMLIIALGILLYTLVLVVFIGIF